jgi:glutamate dehydrogenase/leucine dehydrogenase
VAYCRDQPAGLRATIAIHDTNLGPARGCGEAVAPEAI